MNKQEHIYCQTRNTYIREYEISARNQKWRKVNKEANRTYEDLCEERKIMVIVLVYVGLPLADAGVIPSYIILESLSSEPKFRYKCKTAQL